MRSWDFGLRTCLYTHYVVLYYVPIPCTCYVEIRLSLSRLSLGGIMETMVSLPMTSGCTSLYLAPKPLLSDHSIGY